jgi:hypothetical protein
MTTQRNRHTSMVVANGLDVLPATAGDDLARVEARLRACAPIAMTDYPEEPDRYELGCARRAGRDGCG